MAKSPQIFNIKPNSSEARDKLSDFLLKVADQLDMALEYNQILHIAVNDSLAGDGLEMIYAAMRGDS